MPTQTFQYRGFTIVSHDTSNGERFTPVQPDGTPLDWQCRTMDDAMAVIDARIRRAEAMAELIAQEALARAMAPIVTNARKLGRRAIDAHPLI
jgi:hypothetical protein